MGRSTLPRRARRLGIGSTALVVVSKLLDDSQVSSVPKVTACQAGDPTSSAEGCGRLDPGPRDRERQRSDRAMIAYFDTSALIKLVVAEAGADQARLLWEQAGEIVVSRLAWPEALAALAAARRGRRLSSEGHTAAVRLFRTCSSRCTVISVADHLVERAAELAAGDDLRAADAIHLATALAVMEPDSVFVTWDKRLRQAATQVGLVTAPAHP
jgi:predicted nucleic acid-binding protein